jgi:hypothetical protein
MGPVLILIFWFVAIAVVINFVNLATSLLSAVTGRSFMPGFLRRMRRKAPVTADDQRVLGMTLTLLSVGQLLMMVALLVVVTLAAAQGSGGHAPVTGLYLVTVVGFVASVACTFASLALGRRVRYRADEPPSRIPEIPLTETSDRDVKRGRRQLGP